ncbi:bromodomain associated protein [Drechmeria coniospora]|uniref:Transcription initiation factor TFIID subunit 8 n=1 Tax=Drechmeria coniospora TaxID=98403 RepID=A0A151GLQ9_DRECN|nr:bromodomain associated protein [Drechmeria coniospora]KYK58044.1 bromodomain associated protein [Drechmeria coniospora]ODA83120.1 hypothetical protein RJ55_01629 [Drechmeria coniospora]
MSKRSLSPHDASESGSEPKRTRVDAPRAESPAAPDSLLALEPTAGRDGDDGETAIQSLGPTHHFHARCGLQRSIAVVLRHDGFDSATPEAMESFTALVESYMESMVEEIKRFAIAARRERPTPVDFALMLRHHNLPIASLMSHLKNPVPKEQRAPTFADVVCADSDALTTLPLLGPELSGQADKEAMSYIPPSFPDFPSQHTYRFTPREDTVVRDSKKIREEAARTAQQGEDALRRLVRASKMRKQKEVKSLVERDPEGKERFRLWESTMKRFMGAEARAENADQVDISQHSMIVNGDAVFARREVSRQGKRSAGLSVTGK